jgi:carbon-monoxide dehydrogenase large subunit
VSGPPHIGQRLPRLEDRRLVTGGGRYTDDVSLPGQVWAAFLRSPHAHADIAGIDTAPALALPGVLAVLTGADYLADGHRGVDHIPNPADAVRPVDKAFAPPASGPVYNRRHLPLPVDRVRHVGEAVVMVIAETPLQARDGAEAVVVDYRPLPATLRADDALAPGAPQLYDDAPGNLCFEARYGDADAVRQAFARAAFTVRRTFRNSRIVNAQMEPRSALGQVDPGTGLHTLISGSQGVHRQHMGLCDALGLKAEQLRVVCPDVGGGFGPRSSLNMEQVAVLWAARRVGRPVKWTSDRSEAFVSDHQGRDLLVRAAIAFDADGRILALDHELFGNVGAHTVSYVPMANHTRVLTSVYDVPSVSLTVRAALTNTVPTGPYRGAGRPEAMHVFERLLDIAAREQGLDRIDLRRRNLLRRERLPRLSPMGLPYDAGDFPANMERVLAMADWDGFPARRAEARARGRLRGIGLANYIESPVGAPRERVRLTVDADARAVQIVAGTQSTGQGHATTFAQVVADQLGLDPQQVRLSTGDTADIPVGGGSHSDRSMRLGGALLLQASATLLQHAASAAAEALEAPAERVRREGFRFLADDQRSVDLFDLARHVARHGRADDRSVRTLTVEAEFSGRMPAFPTGAAVCELEVDPDTGTVHLQRYSAVDDVGRPINPLIVEGQVHGGLAQGLGQALCETHAMDDEGQVLSGSFMDYGMPRAGLIPPLAIALADDPTLGNPLGVKGGGESGITPATAATFNALHDALSEHTTAELPMPATPLAVWSALHRAGTHQDQETA